MNWFTKWLKAEDDKVVTSVPEPIVEDVKVPLIIEPVLSLIESLENREWKFVPSLSTYSSTAYVCKHLSKLLKFTASRTVWMEYGKKEYSCTYKCLNSWMTSEESELVARTVFKVIEEENKEWEIANNYNEREKFMILTKEKQ